MSRIFKELKKFWRTNNPINKWVSELNRHFQMNEYKWPTITFLKYSSSLVIREKKYICGWGDSFLGKVLTSQVVGLSLMPRTQTQEIMCIVVHTCNTLLRRKENSRRVGVSQLSLILRVQKKKHLLISVAFGRWASKRWRQWRLSSLVLISE